jgi:type II secretory ATPase GspE/PulE/Tfp pilus assembly ATPase PilB-like protein
MKSFAGVEYPHRQVVEYTLPVEPSAGEDGIGLTFAAALHRSCGRTDIILVGEIRDWGGGNTVEASLTGHLLSRRYIRTMPSAVTRFDEMGSSRS